MLLFMHYMLLKPTADWRQQLLLQTTSGVHIVLSLIARDRNGKGTVEKLKFPWKHQLYTA